MAWTTPATFSTGQLIGASDLNTYVRDNTNYLLSGRPQSALKRNNGANYTTTATSFADIDTTNLTVTLTLSGTSVLVYFAGSFETSAVASNQYYSLDITIDGVRYAGTNGIVSGASFQAALPMSASFIVLVTGLSAGSHTFRPQWKVTGTVTATLLSNGDNVCFGVQEIN